MTETRSHNPPVKTDSTVDKAIYIKINFYRIIQVSDFFGFSDVVAFGGVGSGNVSGNNAGCCKGWTWGFGSIVSPSSGSSTPALQSRDSRVENEEKNEIWDVSTSSP